MKHNSQESVTFFYKVSITTKNKDSKKGNPLGKLTKEITLSACTGNSIKNFHRPRQWGRTLPPKTLVLTINIISR